MNKQIQTAYVFASSSSDKTYQTLVMSDGSITCECPGWTRRVQPNGSRTCRHVRDVELGVADRTSLSRYDYGVSQPAKWPSTTPTRTVKKAQPELPMRGRVFDLE